MVKYGLLVLLGIGLPLALIVTQTGTTRIQCDRRSTGVHCQQDQTLLYGLLNRPQRAVQVENAYLDEDVRSANDGDRTYTIYTVYLETPQGEMIFESTRSPVRAQQSLSQITALLQGRTEGTLTQRQGGLERTLAATITATGMFIGACIVLLRAKP